MAGRRVLTVLAAAVITLLLGAAPPAAVRVPEVAASVSGLTAASAATTATTTTTTTVPATTATDSSSSSAGSGPVISLGRTGQAVFIGVIIGVFAALWFVLILYDRISANRRLNHFLPGLLQGVERRDTDHQLSAEQIKAITSAIREPATGARGLTRTTIALGLVTLVGVALVSLLVGNGNNASDLLKTVVTALTTALATVLGFYFGAKTASEAASSKGDAGATTPGLTKPGPPTQVVAEAGDRQATVSFKAPTTTGGSPITGYTVTSKAEGKTGVTATGDKSPIVVTGLENGVMYAFTVHATNAIGDGPESSESDPVTPQPK